MLDQQNPPSQNSAMDGCRECWLVGGDSFCKSLVVIKGWTIIEAGVPMQ